MYKLKMEKLAKIKFCNNFEVIKEGDHVICCIWKENPFKQFELLECGARTLFFIYRSSKRRDQKINSTYYGPDPLIRVFKIIFSIMLFNSKVIFSNVLIMKF